MKRYALILSVLSALVLAPTGALAKDKHKKHKHCDDKQARLEADRRANGYYDYRPSYYRPSYSSYSSRGYYDDRCSHDRRSYGYRR